MKLIHISDLHIGKRLLERSLIEDQAFILKKIENIIFKERPDGVLIAGDVYDKAVPSSEAVNLFNDFLTNLAQREVKVFVISGNHDSADRIGFGSFMLARAGVFVSPAYSGTIEPISLEDEFGELNIYLLPFIKPSFVKSYFPDEEIESYSDAVRFVIGKMNIDTNRRNILVAHQFVGHAQKDGSEEASIGGLDVVDDNLFDGFDYVALGHIHRKQTLKNKLRYSGTPLQYAFSERGNNNSITVVEIKEKDNLAISEIELIPKRKMVEIRGKFEELTKKEYYQALDLEHYYRVVLTDENDIIDGANKLRVIYKNMLSLDYDNRRTNASKTITAIKQMENKSTLELFSEFYEKQNGQAMSKDQTDYMDSLIKSLREGK